MIEIKNLSKVYVNGEIEKTALNMININIPKGEFVAIMGPDGSGKSTLLNILGLIESPTAGNYIFGGEHVAGYSKRQRTKLRNRSVGFVFQNFNLIDELTVFENVALPLHYLSVPAAWRNQQVDNTLEKLHIVHRRNYFPNHLSGVQQQRVAIARAIIAQPNLIIADEPTRHLNAAGGEEIMKVLAELNENGTIIVLVTRSSHVANYAHRIVHLYDGKIVTENIMQKDHS